MTIITYLTTEIAHIYNHNNYEHNVINKVNKHNMFIAMILEYIVIIRNHAIKENHNFYHDTFNFRNNELSHSQQTDITNNLIETNTQTTNYIEICLHNNIIATVIVNPTPPLMTTTCGFLKLVIVLPLG